MDLDPYDEALIAAVQEARAAVATNRHRLQTESCPSFGALMRGAQSGVFDAMARTHLAQPCPYCAMTLAMAFAEQCPTPAVLAEARALGGALGEALERHAASGCRSCPRALISPTLQEWVARLDTAATQTWESLVGLLELGGLATGPMPALAGLFSDEPTPDVWVELSLGDELEAFVDLDASGSLRVELVDRSGRRGGQRFVVELLLDGAPPLRAEVTLAAGDRGARGVGVLGRPASPPSASQLREFSVIVLPIVGDDA